MFIRVQSVLVLGQKLAKTLIHKKNRTKTIFSFLSARFYIHPVVAA